LVHVPADKHQGPDALSRHPIAEGETVVEEDDTWLDDIALLTFDLYSVFPPFPKLETAFNKEIGVGMICYLTQSGKNDILQAIYDFHQHATLPVFGKPQNRKQFINKCGEYFLKDTCLYKKNGNRPPLIVVMDPEHKNSILLHAHEKLGHRGIYAVQKVI
jgi:hypothetical protein